MENVLTGQNLRKISVEMFGAGWKEKLAEAVGISPAYVSTLASKSSVPAKTATKVIELRRNWEANGGVPVVVAQEAEAVRDPDADLTDEQVLERINKRFGVMNRMIDGMLSGHIRSMIVSGAPGIGKTYDLELALEKAFKETGLYYHIIRGTCSAPGLYQSMYHGRKGGVIVLDDCDSIFNDEQAFNILKAGLDTTNKRVIAWRKRATWVYDARDEDRDDGEVIDTDERVPNEFEFEGSVVFITNLNFRERGASGNRTSPHFQALLSRSMYLDLTLSSYRARILRIKDVFLNSMCKTEKLNEMEAKEILYFVLANADRFHELSLRTVKHICQMYRLGPDWKEIVEYTKMNTL